MDSVQLHHGDCLEIMPIIQKAYEQRNNAVTVMLIPARTNTNWWHEYCMEGEVMFICGRPKFKGCVHGLPQPLALVVFGRGSGVIVRSISRTRNTYDRLQQLSL